MHNHYWTACIYLAGRYVQYNGLSLLKDYTSDGTKIFKKVPNMAQKLNIIPNLDPQICQKVNFDYL